MNALRKEISFEFKYSQIFNIDRGLSLQFLYDFTFRVMLMLKFDFSG